MSLLGEGCVDHHLLNTLKRSEQTCSQASGTSQWNPDVSKVGKHLFVGGENGVVGNGSKKSPNHFFWTLLPIPIPIPTHLSLTLSMRVLPASLGGFVGQAERRVQRLLVGFQMPGERGRRKC